MKVALVHDWPIHMRGGEKVLEAIAELYPEAPIYCLFYNRKKLSPILKNRVYKASILHYLPGILKYYRWLLPFMPMAIRSLKIKDVDMVISTSHCVAKGIRIAKGIPHICYCHTPIRYAWLFRKTYFGHYPEWLQKIMNFFLDRVQAFDLKTNASVTQFVANSKNVADRIQKFYNRKAEVIYPPFENQDYYIGRVTKNYYLAFSHFVPYKKIDLVIETFNHLDKELIVIGKGPLEEEYRELAKSPKISFVKGCTNAELRLYYSEARALIFPAEEDFGIIPIEAEACGTPVIAYGKGGTLETVKSGVFFYEQTEQSLKEAIAHFETLSFDPAETAEKVKSFSRDRFQKEIIAIVHSICKEK